MDFHGFLDFRAWTWKSGIRVPSDGRAYTLAHLAIGSAVHGRRIDPALLAAGLHAGNDFV